MNPIKKALVDVRGDLTDFDLLEVVTRFIEEVGLEQELVEYAKKSSVCSSWDNAAGVEYRDNLHCARLR